MSVRICKYRPFLISLFMGLTSMIIGSISAHSQHVILEENFENASGSAPPSGWEFDLLSGNSRFDSFYFNSDQFLPALPLDKHCASFDVYNGGFAGRSNGDGNTEDVALVSSEFGFDSSEIEVEFDHLFTRLRSPKVFVEIRFGRSLNWQPVWGDSSGNTKPEHIQIKVRDIPDTTKFAQIRFRWKTENTLNTQGYWLIDNVRVVERLSQDLALKSVNPGQLNICHFEGQRLSVLVSNAGSMPHSTAIISTTLENDRGKVGNTILDTINSLKVGEYTTLTFKWDSLTTTGEYYLKSTLITSDQWRSNDSCIVRFKVHEGISNATVTDASRCGPGEVDLKGSSSEDLLWLDPDRETSHLGSTYTTPFLYHTDTFKVQQINRTKSEIQTGQGPYRFNGASSGGSYLRVIAQSDLTLDKVMQHFATANRTLVKIYTLKGDYQGKERDASKWSLIFSDSIDTKGWGTLTSLDIPDQVLFKGDTLSLYVNCIGSSIYTFKQGSFEFEDRSIHVTSDAVNNTAFSGSGPLYTPFAWDGSLSYSSFCKSALTDVVANIVDRPIWRGFQKHNSYFGLMRTGSESDPDQLSENGKGVYEVPAPHYKLRSGYGTTWRAELRSVKTLNGRELADSFFWFIAPTSSSDLQVGFAPKGQWIDSTVIIEMVITDLQTECDTSVMRFIHISRTPIPEFTWQGQCADVHVQFTNDTRDRDSCLYDWNFGDGRISRDKDPVHRFRTSGSFAVKLTATNKFGISGSIIDTVNVFDKPDMDARVVHACLGTDIQIILLGKSTLNAKYNLFHSGNQLGGSVGPDTFRVNFPSDGKYSLELKALNESCPDSAVYQAYQFPVPTADFTTSGICANDSIVFNNRSRIADNAKLGYRWHKDGLLFETRESPILISSDPGLFNISLQSISEFGCTDTFTTNLRVEPSPIAHFNASLACNNEATAFKNTSDLPTSLRYSYAWDFGDGHYSMDSSPYNRYEGVGERKVSLVVTADNGCESRYDTSLIVRVQPNARFHVSDICSGDEAVFVNFSKVENKILNYLWRFGDGQSSEIHSPRHVYTNDETQSYRVILEVFTDDNSCRDEFDTTITVHQTPSCDFDFRSTGDPLEIILSANDEEILEYTWSFEGGGVSVDPEPIHRFQVPGTYAIQLFARTSAGCECTLTKEIAVGLLSSRTNELQITVYPNPTEGKLIYNITGSIHPVSVEISDAAGRLIWQQDGSLPSGNINVTDLSSGLYLLTLRSDDQELHWKFQKK